MHSTQEELRSTLDRMKGLPLLVAGDLILDRYIWGGVDRISPEAPVPVVKVSRTDERLGGAGNVVRNLRNVGVDVSVCGFVGNDDEGQAVLKLLESDGVTKDGVIIDRTRPTIVKTRVIARTQQLVRIDREEDSIPSLALRQGLAAVIDAHIDPAKAVIISDYGKGTITEPVLKSLQAAGAAGRLGLRSRPLVVDPHPVNYSLYDGITLAKPNRREAEIASGMKITDRTSAFAAARVLMKKWNAEMMMITLGEGGLIILAGDEEIFRETVAREVYDVSGAGDTVTALFTAALASGAPPAVAGDLANIAAGIVVSEVGTVAVTLDKLHREIERLE